MITAAPLAPLLQSFPSSTESSTGGGVNYRQTLTFIHLTEIALVFQPFSVITTFQNLSTSFPLSTNFIQPSTRFVNGLKFILFPFIQASHVFACVILFTFFIGQNKLASKYSNAMSFIHFLLSSMLWFSNHMKIQGIYLHLPILSSLTLQGG